MFKSLSLMVLLFSPIVAFPSASTDAYDGRNFVAAFSGYKADITINNHLTLTFISSGDQAVTGTIKYWNQKSNTLKSLPLLIPGGGISTSQSIPYSEVVDDQLELTGNLNKVQDSRIRITADAPIKVVASSLNTNILLNKGAIGDAYLIPETSVAGNKYVVRMPKAIANQVQLINIAAIDKAATGFIKPFIKGEAQSEQKFNLASDLGSEQVTFAADDGSDDRAYYIESDMPVLVTVTVTCADLSFASGNDAGLAGGLCDFVSYVASPIKDYDGQSILSATETRVITSQYTSSAYVSPYNLNMATLRVTTFNDDNLNNGNNDELKTMIGNVYPFDGKTITEFAVQSKNTFTSMARVGVIRDTNNVNLINSMFLSYVPETTQFITGDNTFVAFSDNSILEVYGSNLDSSKFTLDGKMIGNADIQKVKLDLLNNGYSSYVIKIAVGGIRTFNSPGNYIAYAIGSINDKSTSQYGYLTGYGNTKITADSTIVPVTPFGTDPTTTSTQKITTTTKGGFVAKASILTVVLSVFFVMA